MRKHRESLTGDELFRREWQGFPSPTRDPEPQRVAARDMTTHMSSLCYSREDVAAWSREKAREIYTSILHAPGFEHLRELISERLANEHPQYENYN